ncbi:uncharacterized protein TM35_000191650 [Trypanosoma theileri]|uniref:Uncharacterized protein n=1 Tax=Trypanosoma theileri TaxID=67003 RepID=A0A1X0NTI9_9TRYP|nr:uncharacterized protein TM35_000191650 [Trypanosoma theileri]ORC87921.1 hypothetical protein TM35_000191650 [Trypanosoma theileri]
MPIVRPTRWDHETLPYVPAGNLPCLLFYLLPGDNVPRVVVPNARGEYPHLIPGMPYMEELADEEAEGEMRAEKESEENEKVVVMRDWGRVMPVLEFAPPPLHEDVGTQVGWEDLPAPPLSYLRNYTDPTQQRPSSSPPSQHYHHHHHEKRKKFDEYE